MNQTLRLSLAFVGGVVVTVACRGELQFPIATAGDVDGIWRVDTTMKCASSLPDSYFEQTFDWAQADQKMKRRVAEGVIPCFTITPWNVDLLYSKTLGFAQQNVPEDCEAVEWWPDDGVPEGVLRRANGEAFFFGDGHFIWDPPPDYQNGARGTIVCDN